MMTTNDLAKVYDTVLAFPRMNELVKFEVKTPLKNMLLLASVLERGLSAKDDDKPSLLNSIAPEAITEIRAIITEILQKAQLNDLLKN